MMHLLSIASATQRHNVKVIDNELGPSPDIVMSISDL